MPTLSAYLAGPKQSDIDQTRLLLNAADQIHCARRAPYVRAVQLLQGSSDAASVVHGNTLMAKFEAGFDILAVWNYALSKQTWKNPPVAQECQLCLLRAQGEVVGLSQDESGKLEALAKERYDSDGHPLDSCDDLTQFITELSRIPSADLASPALQDAHKILVEKLGRTTGGDLSPGLKLLLELRARVRRLNPVAPAPTTL
eukprot:CAMPEP_0197850788 /NCGR_PEP_ID=MMETSP1438-20131217/16386_1 /TAXON_ID=1461541 /ORGANISM="Pterosperma sp., Strain CCMP1384" /LENGTH=200 /DNA_ID=CAMNT_0043464143 /DNA_START=48 /DNA_END=650 /DNA_ORIENTATION=-